MLLDNTHHFDITIIAVLAACTIDNNAFQNAFIPVASGQWVWYIPFQIVRFVAVHILFVFSVVAAFATLVATLLGTGASYLVLGAKWAAYGTGAVALVVVRTLLAVGWYTAVCDISHKSFLWCKALLGYEVREVKELQNGDMTDKRMRVGSVLTTEDKSEHKIKDKKELPRGFIGGREYVVQTQAAPVSVHCVGCGMGECYEVGSGMCSRQGGTYWRWSA